MAQMQKDQLGDLLDSQNSKLNPEHESDFYSKLKLSERDNYEFHTGLRTFNLNSKLNLCKGAYQLLE